MTDDEQIDEIIREIAEKHQIVVSRNDPILVLQTINNRLLQNGQKAQQAMIEQLKEELEAIAMRWSEEAKEKAERILNASLTASKESMEKLMLSGAREIQKVVQADIELSLKRINASSSDARNIALLNIISASFSIIAAAIVLWAIMQVSQ
jgi:cell division septum initiation protein DivIVA